MKYIYPKLLEIALKENRSANSRAVLSLRTSSDAAYLSKRERMKAEDGSFRIKRCSTVQPDLPCLIKILERASPSAYIENMLFIAHGPALQLAEKPDENERFLDLRRLILHQREA